MKTLLQATAIALASALAFAPATQAGEVYEIDQISDLYALTPEQFYRFEPNYFWVQPGDTIRFLNSIGNHTVTTVIGVWPEGVEVVDIEHKPTSDVILDTPGIYGFKCKIHNRHGMFALVIVGDVEPDFDLWQEAALNDVGKRVFEALFAKFEADYAAR